MPRELLIYVGLALALVAAAVIAWDSSHRFSKQEGIVVHKRHTLWLNNDVTALIILGNGGILHYVLLMGHLPDTEIAVNDKLEYWFAPWYPTYILAMRSHLFPNLSRYGIEKPSKDKSYYYHLVERYEVYEVV